MTDKYKDLLLADALLLQQMLDVEQQYLKFTARTLSAEIKQRFGVKRQALTQRHTKGFAEIYTSAIVTAWLYGAYHIQKLIKTDDVLELAGNVYDVPFEEAQDYLKAQITIDKKEFNKLEANLKFRAFTIAKVSSEDVINKVKVLYQDQLSQGYSKPEVLQQLDAILDRTGISEANPSWLHTHYSNNMMAAYNAGRWTQIESNQEIVDLLYNAIKDGHTTDLCNKLHGMKKPKRDPIWDAFYPTNHHQCRSIATPITRAISNSRGLKTSNITTDEIYEDPELEKQHQFKAHPAATIKTLPESLAKRAVKYGLVKDVLKYTAISNKAFFKTRLNDMAKTTLSREAINDAATIQEYNSDLIDKAAMAIAEPDVVLLSLSTEQDNSMSATLLSLRWLDVEHQAAMVVKFNAFDDDARTYYTVTAKGYEQLLAGGGYTVFSR